MTTLRNWTNPPNPIPILDLNLGLAEQVIYHVDADRKLTGATLKMSSGNQIEADASAAATIFRIFGNNDYETREFLGLPHREIPPLGSQPDDKPKWVLWLFILMLIVLLWIIFEPLIKR